MCDALLLMCNCSTLAGKNDQLLLMHRPTIAHALTEQLLVGYRAIMDQLLITSWAIMPHHVIPTIGHYDLVQAE
jgi:hypothetical protein